MDLFSSPFIVITLFFLSFWSQSIKKLSPEATGTYRKKKKKCNLSPLEKETNQLHTSDPIDKDTNDEIVAGQREKKTLLKKALPHAEFPMKVQ